MKNHKSIKNKEKQINRELNSIIENYILISRKELDSRLKKWRIDLTQNEYFEVIGGLLARQVSLATNLVSSPAIWNPHISPIILRTMIDTYIIMAWIFLEPLERSRKFILFGIGQEKLFNEHLKQHQNNIGENKRLDIMVNSIHEWVDSQRFYDLTTVDVGSWSGTNMRKMAEEAGCIEFYNFSYIPFSSCTHSMWNHISKFNLIPCKNPLHKFHKVPIDSTLSPDFEWIHLSSKYLDKTFKFFDEQTSTKIRTKSSFVFINKSIKKLSKKFVN